MDIRSFFGTPSGGSDAAKPKSPASASKKSGQGKPASRGKKSSAAAAKQAGSNKGAGKMTLESNSKSKASKQGKSSPPQADNDDDDDDDDVVEVVPQQRSTSSAAGKSGSGGSSSSNSSRRRRAAKSAAVNYKEDDDEDSEGGGDNDKDDYDDDDFEGDSASAATPSKKKRKSASSPAAAKKSNKSNKRVIVEEEEEEEEEDGAGSSDDVQEVTSTSSKHFSSSPSPLPSSPTKRKAAAKAAAKVAAKAATTAVKAATDKAGRASLSSKKAPATVDLGGTSSDEPDDEEEEEEQEEPAPTPTPPLKKKKPAPASSSTKKATPGSGGGGGGGFRPPWRGGGRIAPPNEGNKEVPAGREQCLAGKTFVVSGVLDSLGREAAEDLIKQYGGKVTGSVSSKTMFLLLGSILDDGRPPEEGSKYKKAKTLKAKSNISIIDEDALFKMLKDSNPSGGSPAAAAASGGSESSAAPPSSPSSSSSSAAAAAKSKPAVVNPYPPKKAIVNPYAASMAAPKKAPGGGGAVVNPYGAAAAGKAKPAGKGPAGSSGGGSSAVSQKPGQMWVDKYKPTSSSGVIGHAGQVKKLKVWLQSWESWHLKSTGAKPPTGKDNPGARAALLSGVPGVGKSSTATLVAREMGYHIMELNASDTRSKRSLSEELSSVIGNKVLSFGGGSGATKTGGFRKQLVVMDEVDGMGGSDRGGIQELILLIKKSRVPIICICNDRQHQKIRSLANHCYDLRFSRPQKVTIAKRVKAVAKMEGMDVDDNAAEMLVEANGNDIRQVLHALQMWSRKSSKLTYMNLKGGITAIEKDKNQRVGPFDAARLILGGASRTPLRDRYELFFTDYSLLPLLVHQNYLSSLNNLDAKVRTDVAAAASAAVSDADIISGKMRGDVQHWELLPAQAALNVRVGSIGGGSLGFPEFPKWLGNYSRENKRRRLLGELSTHLNASVSGGTEAVRLSYLHFLKTALTKPLRDDGADGAPACVALMEEYGLSRDDLFEVMPEFQLSTKGMKKPPPDVFASLDSKAKSAVTRCYNAQSHKSQALVETLQAPKKAKKRKAPPKSLSMEGVEEDEEGGESSEEEEDDNDVSVFKKKSRAAPGTAKKGKAAAKPRAKKTKK